MVRDEDIDKLRLVILIIVLVTVAGTYLGISSSTINQINNWLISIFTGMVISLVVNSFVEALTGDFLKKILITIPITEKIKFSISLFTVATLVVRYWLFGSF
jgi:hypothetical protein